MKQDIYTVIENRRLTPTTWLMKLEGDVRGITAPGQFINIKLDGHFLRRPISICDLSRDSITIIYKVLGHGTDEMTRLPYGHQLDVLTGLGNGYSRSDAGDRPLLIGGGVGIPPLYNLCKQLIAKGAKPTVILGFNSSYEIFALKTFEKLGVRIFITTVDGSVGTKGFVTDAFPLVGEYSYFYTCGPLPMFKAVYDKTVTSGEFSFEERMGCGFGACMGCTCKTKYGNKRICKDGPVLVKEEIIW